MVYVYLDESGDLGFGKEGSSDFFVITLLLIEDPTPLKRLVKKIRQRKLKRNLKELPEIKANNSDETVRKRFLRDLAKEEIEIHCIILDKNKVYDYLKKEKEKLYNYVSGIILTESTIRNKNINIIVDKKTSRKVIIEDFNQYIVRKVEERHLFHTRVKISHYDSKNSPGLQAVDFASWSIFRKYEWNDDRYYNLIREKITTEKKLFK